jgi:hypothetical protein
MLSRIAARCSSPLTGVWPFPQASLSARAGGAPPGDDRALPHRRDRGLTRPAHSHSVPAADGPSHTGGPSATPTTKRYFLALFKGAGGSSARIR